MFTEREGGQVIKFAGIGPELIHERERAFRNASIHGAEPPPWVRLGNPQNEQMFSALPQ